MDTQLKVQENPAAPTGKKKSKFVRFFDHPWTGRIGIVASIIGIPLTIYLAREKKADLHIYLDPVRTTILQLGKASSLSVSMGGKPIATDISAAQFNIVNLGKAPIRHDDILQPVTIVAVSNCPIYEVTLRKTSRDVIGFKIETNLLSKGIIQFDWKILERNDGASIQIIYGSGPNFGFAAGGAIVGQSRVPFELTTNKDRSTHFWEMLINGLTFSAIAGFLSSMARDLVKSAKLDYKKGRTLRVYVFGFVGGIIILAVAFLIGALVYLFILRPAYPPWMFL